MLKPSLMKRVIEMSIYTCERFSPIEKLVESKERVIVDLKYRTPITGYFVSLSDHEHLKTKNMVRFFFYSHVNEGVVPNMDNTRIFSVEDFKSICTTSYND